MLVQSLSCFEMWSDQQDKHEITELALLRPLQSLRWEELYWVQSPRVKVGTSLVYVASSPSWKSQMSRPRTLSVSGALCVMEGKMCRVWRGCSPPPFLTLCIASLSSLKVKKQKWNVFWLCDLFFKLPKPKESCENTQFIFWLEVHVAQDQYLKWGESCWSGTLSLCNSSDKVGLSSRTCRWC